MAKSESRRKAEKTARLMDLLIRTLVENNASRDEGALALSSVFALTIGGMQKAHREMHLAELGKMVDAAKELQGHTGVYDA
jgi:hypothetical protein